MRTRAQSAVSIDVISTREAIGELAKLGSYLGRDVAIGAADHDEGSTMSLQSRDQQFLATEIAALVAIEAVASDQLVDDLLAAVRDQLVAWHFPVDRKPSDARPIGSGHVEDE